jgi:hypothetical protein
MRRTPKGQASLLSKLRGFMPAGPVDASLRKTFGLAQNHAATAPSAAAARPIAPRAMVSLSARSWHISDENYVSAGAAIVNAHHRHPMAAI